MAYIPQTPENVQENPAISQGKITENFEALARLFNKNHTDITDETDGGRHKFLSMPMQTSSPSTKANEMALFVKQVSAGKMDLFVRDERDGSETNLSKFETALLQDNGKISFVGNLTLLWGRQYGNRSGGQFHIPFHSGGFSRACFVVTYNVADHGGAVPGAFLLHDFNKDHFEVDAAPRDTRALFYYIAIGV